MMDVKDTVTIRAPGRSYHVEKCYLSIKMKSLIDSTNTIHSSAIYYAISNIVELLTIAENEVTPEILEGGADEDTIEAFRQAKQWELPLVCKILKQRILNEPMTRQTLKVFREVNDVDYPQLLRKYLLQTIEEDSIYGDMIKEYQRLNENNIS